MTKSLTEQWKNGELLAGLYYFRKNDGLIYIEFHDDYRGFCTPEEYIKEVLSPVPSFQQFIGLMDDSKELDKAYDKINLLEKKLEIAQKALKEYANSPIGSKYHLTGIMACIALKEMEGVK